MKLENHHLAIINIIIIQPRITKCCQNNYVDIYWETGVHIISVYQLTDYLPISKGEILTIKNSGQHEFK